MAEEAGQAAALWYVAPGQAEIRTERLPALKAGECRLRARHGALSRGTESLIFRGKVPKSEYARMRGQHTAGDFPFPIKYGYAVVAEVEAGPRELAGRQVFALHPHQTRFDLPQDCFLPLPDGVPPQRAVLAANMETALNALWDGAPGPADRIAVVGGGVVGALVAYLCGRLPGADVTLVDINPARAALAQTLGVSFATPEAGPRECDLVVHASGASEGLATAIELAGDEATVLELSWYGSEHVPVPLGGAFHSRRLKLISSQVGQVAASHRARWNHRRRLAAALALLTDARLDALIAPAVSFSDLPGVLPEILCGGSGVLCQRIDYP